MHAVSKITNANCAISRTAKTVEILCASFLPVAFSTDVALSVYAEVPTYSLQPVTASESFRSPLILPLFCSTSVA